MVGKTFLLAGDATFTIEVPPGSMGTDRSHFTYRIQRVEGGDRWPEAYFVKLLTGPDNTRDYSYLGKLDTFTGQVRLTPKSTLGPDAYAVRLINRVLARVWTEDHDAYRAKGFALHHEGKCGRCGRKLTVPESVASGLGPDCARLMGV